LRNLLYKGAGYSSQFLQVKIKDDNQKKVYSQLAIDTEFFHSTFANPSTMQNRNWQLKLGA
jgi:hypothetical protein